MILLRWLGKIPGFAVNLVLELQDECFGIDHGPIEPSELMQFYGEGFFDLFRLFS
jgi:hypothetical protein